MKSFKELVLGGIQEGSDSPKPRQNICVWNIYWQQKNTGTLAWAIQKIGFWGVHLEGGLSGVVPVNSVKLFASKYLLIWKNIGSTN